MKKKKLEFKVEIMADQFNKEVIEQSHKRLVLVDITTDWCAPCKMLLPILNEVVEEYDGQFLLVKIDADENMKIAGSYRVRGFPTVIAFVNGHEVGRFYSVKPKSYVKSFIDKHIF